MYSNIIFLFQIEYSCMLLLYTHFHLKINAVIYNSEYILPLLMYNNNRLPFQNECCHKSSDYVLLPLQIYF